MTAAQLKDAIEEKQSTRTLYRDLEVLQQEGFPLGDTTCVFRNSAFADDVAKTNLIAILEQYRDDEGHPRVAEIRSL